ncbi:GNAT family N-acetyltransferase [Protaetiibacter larvae]|uniref:GNAT family N-acetyltransferase n=1 Tax=Protaetiibacter larvae TaxID=2592654 RepID=A0A5C1Y438_9MICO|nr:GNAT family N-acetyltransferase [Protaetiibacter larvae]QEO08783.1 GNAT family N-acetyltransferase [Protaetiibacter larvae]
MTSFARPRSLALDDEVSAFHSGVPSLDDWLTLRAIKNEAAGTSRTFVSIERESGRIAGYYCLSSSSISRVDAGSPLGRNAPDPIPVILIGRLAVDERFTGQGVGASLLQDAVLKGIEASHLVGSRAFLVHALSEAAASFYARFGFAAVPHSQRVMYLLTHDAEATIAGITTRG